MRILAVLVLVMSACSQPTTTGGDNPADAAVGADVQFAADVKDAALDDKDGTLDAKDAALPDKDAALDEKDGTLPEKDAALDEKDGAFDAKDVALDAMIMDPDGLNFDTQAQDAASDVADATSDVEDTLSDIADVADAILTDAPAPDVAVLNPKAGCSDGTREGYNDLMLFPTIAACGGAWDQPGIFNMPAKCNRQAGNDGVNSPGTGCTVSDLCVAGWHVCYGKDDVVFRNADGCAGVMTGATPPVFFTTQMSSTGSFMCASGANATNDLFGCGNLGCDFTSNPTVKTMCAPLGLSSHDLCKGLRNDLGCGDWCNHLGKYPGAPNSWDCGTDGDKEALNVVKTHPEQQGGVLCCLD